MNSKTRKSYVAAALSASMLLAATPVFAQEGKVEAKKDESKEICDAKVAAAEAKVSEAQAKVDALKAVKDAKRDVEIAKIDVEIAKAELDKWTGSYRKALDKLTKEFDEATDKRVKLYQDKQSADAAVKAIEDAKKAEQELIAKYNGVTADGTWVEAAKYDLSGAWLNKEDIESQLNEAEKDAAKNSKLITKLTKAASDLKTVKEANDKIAELDEKLPNAQKAAKKANDEYTANEKIVKAYPEAAKDLTKGIMTVEELTLYKDAKAKLDKAEATVKEKEAKVAEVIATSEEGVALAAAKAELEAAKKCVVKPEEGKKPEIVVPEKGNKGDKPKVPHTGVEF